MRSRTKIIACSRPDLLHCPHLLHKQPTTRHTRRQTLRYTALIFLLLAGCDESQTTLSGDSEASGGVCFERHIIDGKGAGADGVHLGDINGDGFPDVVSGWEESADLKVYFHPGSTGDELRARWNSVDVSGGQRVASIEDAAFADMDADGDLDAVVSATEGEKAGDDNRRVRIHQWNQDEPVNESGSWRGTVVHLDEPTDRFMKVRSAQIDGKNGADIVALSRDLFEDGDDDEQPSKRGGVYLFSSPPTGELANTASWQRKRLGEVHKGKSIELIDMDLDTDIDILYAGTTKIAWLENPGPENSDEEWINHEVGAASDLALCDVNGDGTQDIVATAGRKEFPIVAKWFQGKRNINDNVEGWQRYDIRVDKKLPTEFYQLQNFALKSIACGHFLPKEDPAAPADIIITTSGSGHGIFLVVAPDELAEDINTPWSAVPLTEYKWITKYDNIIPVDMDFDGDTDFVTSEENEGLLLQGAGVLWYENKSCE
jgi:hypothetical protein